MKSKEDVTAEVREIFGKTLKIDVSKLEPQTVLKEGLNLDSLDMIEVVYEVEDHFDVQIPEERIQQIKTFQEVVDGLYAALEAKASG